jgi:uncharacterized protein YggE
MKRLPIYASAGLTIGALLVALSVVGGRAVASSNSAPARQNANTNHTLTVNGHGEASVAPDMANITLGVETKGATAQDALSANSSKMSSVISAVEDQGVPTQHIQTSGLSIYYDSQAGQYVAGHELDVRIDSVNKVGAVLDAAVGAGANNSWGVSFGLQDPSQAQQTALQNAVADARKHADAMSAKLQVNITGVGSASEASYYTSPVKYAGASGVAAPSAPTPVQPGQLTVSADISVVYTFTPQ